MMFARATSPSPNYAQKVLWCKPLARRTLHPLVRRARIKNAETAL